jgi:hypothetical protein
MPLFARSTAICAGAAVIVMAAAPQAAAQGKGNAWGRGRSGSPSAASAPAPSSAGDGGAADFFVPSGAGVRNFGAWLDDASVLAPGTGWTTVSFGYWRTPLAREIDVPMVDGGVGLTRRVQVGFSVPFYHVGEPGGPLTRGLGDLYLNAKIQLRDPSTSANGVGFAVIPVLEILSFQPGPEESRVQWALPASVEVQREGWRAFGTAGYFSRGALFAAAGGELALSERAWLVGAITQSHSVETDNLSAALGFAKTRTDVSAGLTVSATPSLAVFGSVGRTISRQDDSSATLALTAGVSYSFAAWTK